MFKRLSEASNDSQLQLYNAVDETKYYHFEMSVCKWNKCLVDNDVNIFCVQKVWKIIMPFQKQLEKLTFSKRSVFVVTHDAFQLRNVIQPIGQFVDYVSVSFSM